MISATEMLGGGIVQRHDAPREYFEMIGAIWSVLMYYFDQI